MARPVGADAEQTRQRLVAAAAERFARCGVAATGLRAVAADAGVSLATIHHHFGGKQALVNATTEAAFGSLAEALRPLEALLEGLGEQVAHAEPDALEGTVARLVRESFRSARAHRQPLRMLMRGVVTEGELDARWRDGALLPFLARVAEVLAGATGREPAALHLDLLSINALGTRFALSSDAELAALLCLSPSDEAGFADAVSRFEDHLADFALRVLLGGRR